MILEVFPSGPLETNAYILADKSEAVVIDPAVESFVTIRDFLRGKNLKAKEIWLTHSHWDHIGDASLFELPVVVHAADKGNLEKPGSDQVPCWVAIAPVPAARFLKDQEELKVGDAVFRVIHTPGHTPGGVCFYCADKGLLISGDTLFKGTYGRVDLPTGNPADMKRSLATLQLLPRETQVFPGHGPATTIGLEAGLEID